MSWLNIILGYFAFKEILSGVIGGAIGGLAMFGLNWWRDGSLAKQKEQLSRESDRLKDDMAQAGNQTLERLKADLGREAETHKLALKKLELLFDKELEATNAFISMKDSLVPAFGSPDYDAYDAGRDLGTKSAKVQRELEAFRTAHFAVLSAPVREKLDQALSAFSFEISEASQDHALHFEKAASAGERLHTAMIGIERMLIEALRS